MRVQTFIVLFRGVGGETKLPTGPLREALTEAGFREVTTYIATGNVVLNSEATRNAVKARVAEVVKQKFDFSKSIMVVTRGEWSRLITENPFPEAVTQPRTLHAFALSAEPSRDAVDALSAKAGATERVVVRGKVLYFHAPEGFGRSKLPPIVDRTLKVASTARNWNTVLKLNELAAKTASH